MIAGAGVPVKLTTPPLIRPVTGMRAACVTVSVTGLSALRVPVESKAAVGQLKPGSGVG